MKTKIHILKNFTISLLALFFLLAIHYLIVDGYYKLKLNSINAGIISSMDFNVQQERLLLNDCYRKSNSDLEACLIKSVEKIYTPDAVISIIGFLRSNESLLTDDMILTCKNAIYRAATYVDKSEGISVRHSYHQAINKTIAGLFVSHSNLYDNESDFWREKLIQMSFLIHSAKAYKETIKHF